MSYEYTYELIRPLILKKGTPVLVTLHGIGADYHDLREIIAPLGDRVLQFHIQGNIPIDHGYAYYLLDYTNQSEQEAIQDARTSLHCFIQSELRELDLLDHPVCLMGFSQGAILSSILLVDYPQAYRAGVILNGRKVDSLKTNLSYEHRDVYVIQGKQDQRFPIPSGKELANYLSSCGCSVTYDEFDVGHGINDAECRAVVKWLRQEFEWSEPNED